MPDRLLQHSTVVSIQGEGYRLKDKRRAGLIHLPAGGVASRSTNSSEWTASGSPQTLIDQFELQLEDLETAAAEDEAAAENAADCGIGGIGSSGVPEGAVSENGRLPQGAGGHPAGDRRRSVLMLPMLRKRRGKSQLSNAARRAFR